MEKDHDSFLQPGKLVLQRMFPVEPPLIASQNLTNQPESRDAYLDNRLLIQ